MKKMLLVLASVMGLGILVSCTQEPQELIITTKPDYVACNYKYGGTATIVKNDLGSIATLSNIEFDSNDYAYISYNDDAQNLKTNCKEYTLKVPVVYETKTTVGNTVTTTTHHSSFTVNFTKIGDDYKFNSGNVNSNESYKPSLSGNPESSEFTVKNIIVTLTYSDYSNNIIAYLDSLTFRRK